jgi:DNA-binding Xre family transcriptional regulator
MHIRDADESDKARFSQLREMCAALDIKPSELIEAGLSARKMYFLTGARWALLIKDRF